MGDEFVVLGLPPDATADEVRAARRELAKRHHPDQGGDADRMRVVNEAADRLLRSIAEGGSSPAARETQETAPADGAAPSADARWSGIARDIPSFTVEALPAETFEALLVVATWIGEVLDDDPPYRLEVYLHEPMECWCSLELVPDAGASTVSLAVAGVGGVPAPAVVEVRDLWVTNLNQIDWS
jgi:hypothetical protein